MEHSIVYMTESVNFKMKGKYMLICFSDIKGILQYRILPTKKQSIKQPVFKFFNFYGSAFIEDEICG